MTMKVFKKCHFLLYDCDDNVIYFDNFDELKKNFNYSIRDLLKKNNKKKGNLIHVVIDNKLYELFAFSDEESEQWN